MTFNMWIIFLIAVSSGGGCVALLLKRRGDRMVAELAATQAHFKRGCDKDDTRVNMLRVLVQYGDKMLNAAREREREHLDQIAELKGEMANGVEGCTTTVHRLNEQCNRDFEVLQKSMQRKLDKARAANEDLRRKLVSSITTATSTGSRQLAENFELTAQLEETRLHAESLEAKSKQLREGAFNLMLNAACTASRDRAAVRALQAEIDELQRQLAHATSVHGDTARKLEAERTRAATDADEAAEQLRRLKDKLEDTESRLRTESELYTHMQTWYVEALAVRTP
jgi:chromosome segregation ATPase